MIVNPQLFNYRLIISSLLVAIAVLAVFSFSAYQSVEKERQFFEEEKKLVESELSQMISSYDEASLQNNGLILALDNAKQDTKIALDSLRLLNSDLSVITKYKNRLVGLRLKNKKLFAVLDSVESVNTDISANTERALRKLKLQQFKNTELQNTNNLLKATIEEAAVLRAMSVKAAPYNAVLGVKVETRKASKTNAIDVCFTLIKNVLTEPGKKDLHIQIVNPSNNVYADKGAIRFGESTLIYSAKTAVNYQNDDIDVCVTIGADRQEQPLEEGDYYINVFHKDKKLGSTKIRLK